MNKEERQIMLDSGIALAHATKAIRELRQEVEQLSRDRYTAQSKLDSFMDAVRECESLRLYIQPDSIPAAHALTKLFDLVTAK